MSRRVHILSRPEHAALGSVANVHRVVFHRQTQEGAILLDQTVIVDAAARHGEDDEVIVDRLGVRQRLEGVVLAVAVQRVGHL